MKFTIESEQETEGRWLAEVIELPGVMVYGHSRQEALAKAQALALRSWPSGWNMGKCCRKETENDL